MENKEYIMKFLSLTEDKKKEEAAAVVCEMLDSMEEEDKEWYDQKIYETVEGKVLTEARARTLINNMTPMGMKWELAETETLRNDQSIRPVDFWIVMNSAYNDYHDLFAENLDYYVKYTNNFSTWPFLYDLFTRNLKYNRKRENKKEMKIWVHNRLTWQS